MSKKYVIEIKPEYEDKFRGIMILGAENSNLYVDSVAVDELEELNSDYINEHYGELQETAYKKGLEDGQNWNEAWKYARKIACLPQNGGMNRAWLDAIFGSGLDRSEIMFTFSAKNAMEKIKAYEKKHADKIKVRDEVVWTEDENVVIVVTSIYMTDNMEWCDGFCKDGKVYSILTENARKTGRRFDIESILEAMKHD